MTTRRFLPVAFAFLLLCAGSIAAQNSQVVAREQEWKGYALPSTEFVRQSDGAKTVLFRVPAAWQIQGNDLSFGGPHSSSIKVFVEKIPDGSPVRDYVVALTQQLQNQPGAESMIVRRTQMSGMEAREILLQIPDVTGVMTHRVIWCAVDGPTAVGLVLITPSAHVGEIEPYFKAVIQSVTILRDTQFAEFETLRSEAIKQGGPARVDEVQSLAETLNGLDQPRRRSSVGKLATVFASSPDLAIDLIMDRRAMVRAAAVEAIALSKNPGLRVFLLRALEDKEPFVAELAARSIAVMPDVTRTLKNRTLDWSKTETLARVWPFLTEDRRLEILREIFSAKVPTSPRRSGTRRQNPEPPTDPLPVLGRVSVRATKTATSQTATKALLLDPSVQLGALALLRDVPANEFKLPLMHVLAANNDTLTRAALEVAVERREELAVEPLLKLLGSSNDDIRLLATQNLGQSGKPSDIFRLEAQIDQLLKTTKPGAGQDPPPSAASSVVDELRLAIRKISLREQVASASSAAARDQIIKQAMTELKLADWVWTQFVRDEQTRTEIDVRDTATPFAARPVSVLPFGENLLPANPTLYTAFPDPLAAFNRLGSAFNAIQMDSAREQADLVLIMSAMREQFAMQVNVEPDASVLDYLGIKATAPAVFASWNAEGAPRGIDSARRHAMVIRVSDRERFERLLGLYQKSVGNFEQVTDFIGGGARFLGLLPGVIPMSAKLLLEGRSEAPKDLVIMRLGFTGTRSWSGYSIKFVAQDKIDSSGHVTRDTAYLTYLGDTAVVTPDLYSMRDVLTRAAKGTTPFAANSEFQRHVKDGADAIYLSDLSELFATSGGATAEKFSEVGALRITNSVWENSFQLKFAESDWAKPLLKFQPEELSAPRDLLPQTTFAYYLMKLDIQAAWTSWKSLFSSENQRDLSSIWAVDFEREVVPELGPECGAAVVGVPNIDGKNWDLPLVLFFQLKSDKLQRLLDNKALFKNQIEGLRMVRIKVGSEEWFAGIRNGFLVLANSEAALAVVDTKEKLASASEFSKAAKRAPAGIVAFGGLALDAAVTAIANSAREPDQRRQLSAIFSIAKAFHSQSFYATAGSGQVEARFAALIGREGRYAVAELLTLSKDFGLTYAVVEARGIPISNQERLNSLRLRIRAKAKGEVDRIIADTSTPAQIAEKKSDEELELTIRPRRVSTIGNLQLPITDPVLAPFLQSTREIRADDQTIIAKAREIVGNDRDAWSVARKLGDWTYQNLKWKRVDYATAAQTLATREADCYEFSQLYVAMARSLGLPARIVSGLAYNGNSFGGHAWVEVYAGQWIELDPTFGTDFVDATHIRDTTGGFLTYVVLNLVELEILDAPRGVADFQLDVKVLAQKLCEQLPNGHRSALTAALDVALLTDQQMGEGSWAAMSEAERERMTSAYRRVTLELTTGFTGTKESESKLRVLRVKENGDRADVLLMHSSSYGELLQRLTFAKSNGGWYLMEALQADTGLHIVSDTLRPTIWDIADRRSGKAPRGTSATPFVRVLMTIEDNPKLAVEIADRALRDDPNDKGLLYAKSLALAGDESIAEASEIWRQLSSGPQPFLAAVFKLASHFQASEKPEDKQQAIELYRRYGALEPDDPRGHTALAFLYDALNETGRAEAEYRVAIEADASNFEVHMDLTEFLAAHQRYVEAVRVLDESAKRAPSDDPLGALFERLWLAEPERIEAAEVIARATPDRMAKSAQANLYLGQMRINAGRPSEALPLLQKAAEIEKKSSDAYVAIAECYRRLHNWAAALSAANTAIAIEAEDADAFYQRACALARLGRRREAMASLIRSVELNPFMALSIEEEADLKILSSMPEFKKIIADRDKQ